MTVSYESTRNTNIKSSASNAILEGLASDGGLYVMRDLTNKKVDLNLLQHKSYKELANYILKLMLDDFSDEKINECVNNAYTDKFENNEVANVLKVGEFYVTELFHGRTSAFKDVALSILPYLITSSYEMNDKHGEIVILTATSGDTGKAALEGFRDVDQTKIIVFYPDNGVSQIQKMQMITQEGKNTYVCAIKGNFDDTQTGVKNIFSDKIFSEILNKNNMAFSSANSINIGRLVPQIVYYFHSYFELIRKDVIKLNDKVNFCVPTGNFGNILAGYYAKMLGLPINKLICASNENNVLYDFIKTGVYDKNRQFHKTISPSMDILISSNLERLLYYISGKDNKLVQNFMESLNSSGKYEVTEKMKEEIANNFYTDCVFKEDTQKTIKEVYEKEKYLMDTHTAVAYKALENYKKKENDTTVSIVLSTASPFKFSRSVYEALYGQSEKEEFDIMCELSEKTGIEIPMKLKALKNKEVLHHTVCEKEEMLDFIKNKIKIK